MSNPNLPRPQRTWRIGTLHYTAAGLAVLFVLLLFGDFAWQLKERSVSATAQIVLKKFNASDFLVGLLVGSVPAAIGLVLGPFIAVRSDRHRGRWGRRIPFLLLPLPFIVVAMACLACSPWLGAGLDAWLGARSPGLDSCVLIAFSACWCVFEIATVVSNAVFGGLINDVVPHQLLGRFYGLFRIVSLADGIIFNYYLIKHAETRFAWIFLGTGLVYGVGFTVMCLLVKEGEYPPPEPAVAAGGGRWSAMRAYLRECFTTPYYIWFFAASIACNLAFAPVNSFAIFYAKSIGMDMETYGHYVAASYACSLILAFPLGMLVDRFHPLRMSIIAIALYAAVMLGGAACAVNNTWFGMVFFGHTVISGTYFTVSASLGQRLFPRSKFAQFCSALGILSAAINMMLPPVLGGILDWTGHWYRLTFILSGAFAVVGALLMLAVHSRFMRLGGPRAYVAPLGEAELDDAAAAPVAPAH